MKKWVIMGLGIMLGLLASCASGPGPMTEDQKKFLEFKQRMRPSQGKTVTLSGVLRRGKLGWWVPCHEWGVYLYNSDPFLKELKKDPSSLEGHEVEVTGSLWHHKGSLYPESGREKTPEHFFLELNEVKIVEVR